MNKRKVISNKSVRKPKWNFGDAYNWSEFTQCVDDVVASEDIDTLDVEKLAKRAAEVLLQSAERIIGYRGQSDRQRKKTTTLPMEIVTALEFKGVLESNWKTKASALSSMAPSLRDESMVAAVAEAERLFNEQQSIISNFFYHHKVKY